ncbi:MAG: IS66 family transposase zinc-finger binding domain-containing protein, partial [Planctomycetota bacterium]
MDGSKATAVVDPPINASLIDKLLTNQLSEAEAREFANQDPECTAFTLLALQQRIAQPSQASGPNTPSSAIPPYEKPSARSTKPKGKKRKRGGQPGHAGRTRPQLPDPDRTREQQCEVCPDCGGNLRRTGQTRTRRSEDIPEDLKPVITEDTIHRDYCPSCDKRVEPKLPDVLPRCTLGNRTLVLSAMLH